MLLTGYSKLSVCRVNARSGVGLGGTKNAEGAEREGEQGGGHISTGVDTASSSGMHHLLYSHPAVTQD